MKPSHIIPAALEALHPVNLQRIAGNIVARFLLSDQARTDRARANRALESDLVEHLGTHLMKCLIYPQNQAYEHWKKEAEVALTNLVDKLMRSQKTVKGLTVRLELWFYAKDLQHALNGCTGTCLAMAVKLVKNDTPSFPPDQHYFSGYGFLVHDKTDEYGRGMTITFQGKPFIESK